MLNNTKIVLSAALFLASASASVAMPHKQGGDLSRADVYGVTATSRAPAAVVVGERVVGQDPDANVRAQLRRDAHMVSR